MRKLRQKTRRKSSFDSIEKLDNIMKLLSIMKKMKLVWFLLYQLLRFYTRQNEGLRERQWKI